MVTSAQAVLGIGVQFLAVVISRMRLTRMAQALLARSCPTPLGQAPSWRLELLVCMRKHGPDYFAHYFPLKLSIYLPFPFPLSIQLFARVGRTTMSYVSVIPMCYSFFLPPRYVGIFFYITSIRSFSRHAFAFSICYYLSMSWLFILFFFFAARLLLIDDFSLLFRIIATNFFYSIALQL